MCPTPTLPLPPPPPPAPTRLTSPTHFKDTERHPTLAMDNLTATVVHTELTAAVKDLTQYGLKLSSRWAAEQLVGIDFEKLKMEESHDFTPPRNQRSNNNNKPNHPDNSFNSSQSNSCPPPVGLFVKDPVSGEYLDVDPQISAEISYAKSLLDLGEFDRASHILSVDGSPKEGLGGLGVFIRAYALYLGGEKRKEEEMVELAEPLQRCKVLNNNLLLLRAEMKALHENEMLDAFGFYMYGVVLKELLQQESPSVTNDSLLNETKDIFVQAILMYPCNWSAWLDLAEICIENTIIHDDVERALGGGDTNNDPNNNNHLVTNSYMYHFFLVHVFIEQQQNDSALQVVSLLSHLFPFSNYLKAQTALAYYNLRDFDKSQEQFLELCESDPFRLEQMDIFSNILYVKECKAELSHLAHTAVKNDKYRPETCCIIGNYYSLKAQHEKAVLYFQRAVKLNRKFLSAWTLMGHEFVELRNTGAAIEAYRRAVDINNRDYRAWYGLGQTYEILNMLLYALYYYRKAAALRPYDARMWCAMGGCYLSLDRRQEAIKSYERAICNNDREGIATRKLAKLYREEGEKEKAARCYQRLVDNVRGGSELDAPEAEALLFLASYHKEHSNFDAAALCCQRLLEYPGPEKEEAKALLREIRSRISA